MEKYRVVIHGDLEDYEVSIAAESNKFADKSWGWFGLRKIHVESGKNATIEHWNNILKTAEKMCAGINDDYIPKDQVVRIVAEFARSYNTDSFLGTGQTLEQAIEEVKDLIKWDA